MLRFSISEPVEGSNEYDSYIIEASSRQQAIDYAKAKNPDAIIALMGTAGKIKPDQEVIHLA